MFAKVVALTTVQLLIFIAFTDVRNVEAVMCTYELSETGIYSCNLINQTIVMESDINTETGTHLSGFSNENVTLLVSVTSIIEIFPSSLVDRFVNLNNVVLIFVDMKRFTKSISNCENLVSIALLYNEITAIPENIFQNCSQLTDLLLSENSISDIDPFAFSGLTQLKRLTLSNNRIGYLDPLTFQPVVNLEILNLDGNSIQGVLSETFRTLPLLTNLTLNSNRITSWSESFLNNNQQLQELRLDRNQISWLSDDTFANLPQLKTLRVGDLLEELPIFNGLNLLEELWLGDNKLKVISGDSFKNLVSLQLLDLTFNVIESVNFTLSPTTAVLPNLTRLNLLFNNIADIPDGTFTMLTNLMNLNLRRNRITFLSAESIRPIVQLRSLDVSDNQITLIERDLFAGVTNLTFLSQGNVCFDGDIDIGSRDDFENRVAGLLDSCFNFATTMRTNMFLVVAALVFANIFAH